VTPAVGTERGTTVFRPRRARLVIYPSAALVLVALIGGAVFAPSEGAGGWTLGSRLALVAIALAVAYFLHRLGAVRVLADDAGVSVINIVHRRRLEWPEVIGVRLLRDDPWMMLDLSDGSAMAAMGVQKADGAFAQEQATRFARMVAERTRAPGGH
jgi:hypothetical protein